MDRHCVRKKRYCEAIKPARQPARISAACALLEEGMQATKSRGGRVSEENTLDI